MTQQKITIQSRSYLRQLVSLVLLLNLVACASNVVVKSSIPAPLVERVNLNTYLHYTDEFKSYVYNENEKSRALSSVNFAEAQIEMFDGIFGGLTTLVAEDDPSRDITIEPEVLDFQYTAPKETSLKQYEVWLKYRLKITDSENNELADWTIKGYGKTPTALLTSASQAFSLATNVALRDIGALLATGFSGQRKIKALLAKQGQDASVDLGVNEPDTPASVPETGAQASTDEVPVETKVGATDE